MLKKDWIDYADEYICLLAGSGMKYEVILVRDGDREGEKLWFHGVLFLDDYSEDELKENLAKFGFDETDVDADSFLQVAAVCLADLQEQRTVPEQWAMDRIYALTGMQY